MKSKTSEHCEFRSLLQQEFVERCRRNPRYSLRAFAKALAIPASPLSAMLRGKRPITLRMRMKLGEALGIESKVLDQIQTTQFRMSEYQQLQEDAFEVISDWYHYAILELTYVKGFKGEFAFISKRLGISQTEAQIAVERLIRLGMLEVKKSGVWVDQSQHATNISGSRTSEANKKLQRQVLTMALRALDEVPVGFRNQTSMTMAIHPKDLPEAIDKIKKFRRELCAFFEKNKTRTQVYNLCVSLYPVHFQEVE